MNPLDLFRRVLRARPAFIRLLNALFAVLVGFGVVDITAEQFALVVVAVEALFSYASQLAFEKDIATLSAAAAAAEV